VANVAKDAKKAADAQAENQAVPAMPAQQAPRFLTPSQAQQAPMPPAAALVQQPAFVTNQQVQSPLVRVTLMFVPRAESGKAAETLPAQR
jgi:hypothetical protein